MTICADARLQKVTTHNAAEYSEKENIANIANRDASAMEIVGESDPRREGRTSVAIDIDNDGSSKERAWSSRRGKLKVKRG